MIGSCIVVSFLCQLLFSPAAQPQAVRGQIDALFGPLAGGDGPGYAVGVIRNGRLDLSYTCGFANLETRTRISTKTNFRLASLTKQFTAAAIMLLVRDRKIQYDDPLTGIFREFPAYGAAVTIRNLLNHTSGLRDYEGIYEERMRGTPPDEVPQITDAGVLALMEQQTATDFPPGSRWRYSNSGYALLAMAVERVSHKPFQDFLCDRLFRPLHMDRSVAFVPRKNLVANRAYGYRKVRNSWVFSDQSATSAVLGDGGVYTSIDDLVKWVNALDHYSLLSAAEMETAFTPVNVPGVEAPDHTPAAYGFGWFLDPYKGHRRTWHYGETCGFLTAIQHFPDDQFTVIVLSNRTDTDPTSLALKIADMYIISK